MKIKAHIFVLIVAATVAYSQTAINAPPGAKSKAKPAVSHTGSAPSAKQAAKSAPVKKSPMATKPLPPAKKSARKAGAPVEAKQGPAAPATSRRRDPFISPVQARLEGLTSACSGGKRCLAVNEIVLRGIVKSVNGMIAVVESSAQKTYFLHEKDPIFNGYVQKITPDSVVFREHYIDNIGRDTERDVVKTVNAPVV